jgi:preprotein translocase subunit SecE
VAEKVERKIAQPNAIQRFWRETIGELRKVTWPTTQEALNLTKIVLIVLVAMAILLGILDYAFSWLVGHFFAV